MGSLKNVAAGSAVCMALRRHTHALRRVNISRLQFE
jgi:hypothetical protein